MFELIGHSVLKLRRVRIGFLTDESLEARLLAIFIAGGSGADDEEEKVEQRITRITQFVF